MSSMGLDAGYVVLPPVAAALSHTFAPDVMGADANSLTERSAGFFGEPDVVNPTGHDLGRGLPERGDVRVRRDERVRSRD